MMRSSVVQSASCLVIFVTLVHAAPSLPECTKAPSGVWAYIAFSAQIAATPPGYAVYLVDVGNACANSTYYSDSTRSLDTFSVGACFPTSGEFTFPIDNNPNNMNDQSYTTISEGAVLYTEANSGFMNNKMGYCASTQSATVLYNQKGSPPTTCFIGELSNPSKGKAQRPKDNVFSFNIAAGYSIESIASFDVKNENWIAAAYSQSTGDAILYTVNLNTKDTNEKSYGIIPVDLFYDDSTATTYLLYVTGSLSQCNNNFPTPRPTNPRVRSALLGTVAPDGTVTRVAAIHFKDCLRLHSMSTYDSVSHRYIFYAQKDFGSSQGQYHNGVAYVDLGTEPSGNLTATIGGYWGDGGDYPMYTGCPFNG